MYRAWRIVLPHEHRLSSLPESPQGLFEPFGNCSCLSFSILYWFSIRFCCRGYTENGKAKTIGKGFGKALPKAASAASMKVAMKAAVKKTAMKAAGPRISPNAGSGNWWPSQHLFPCARLFCIFQDTKKQLGGIIF